MTCAASSREQNFASQQGEYPRVKPGFYTTQEEWLSPYECFTETGVCLGDLPASCVSGRSGMLCRTCAVNEYRSTDTGCEKCSSQTPLLVILILVGLICCALVYKVANDPLFSE